MWRLFWTSLAVATSLWSSAAAVCSGQEPGWTSQVIKRGADRTISENTDILLRPYRPLHFYGNTVRRAYYRGRALPNTNDVRTTVRLLITR